MRMEVCARRIACKHHMGAEDKPASGQRWFRSCLLACMALATMMAAGLQLAGHSLVPHTGTLALCAPCAPARVLSPCCAVLTLASPPPATPLQNPAPAKPRPCPSSNDLTDLPDELEEFRYLRILRLKYNQLKRIPAVVYRCVPSLTGANKRTSANGGRECGRQARAIRRNGGCRGRGRKGKV